MRIQGLHQEAEAFTSLNPRRRRRHRRELEARLDALVRPVAQQSGAPHRVLAERMRQHLLEWFVFVECPEVPATNNLAERSLRPAVIARKTCQPAVRLISGGTRSDKGSTTKTRLLTLFGTWKLRQQPSLANCQHLLLADCP